MHFLLGRYERTAAEFYGEYVANNELFYTEPIKRMSKLTQNLLHAVDYDCVKAARDEYYRTLYQLLGKQNCLRISDRPGTFMYPLLLKNGAKIRGRTTERKNICPDTLAGYIWLAQSVGDRILYG